MPVTRTAPAAFALGLVVLAGCGGGTGSVTGTVTYKPKGKALVSGTVMVLAADGKPRYGEIAADGRYTVADVPVGKCKVTVSSPDSSGQVNRGAEGDPAAAGRPKMPGREAPGAAAKAVPLAPTGWFAIPDKYGDVNKSELSVDVQRGVTTYNIELN